jgi:hypothetical protein
MTDWRVKELRESVFLDFYEFHLRYRSHPGGVYYVMPYLRDKLGWSLDEALWYAFINGNTQHPVTSLILFEAAPSINQASELIDFWKNNYESLEFDTDRRYHKKAFDTSVESYVSLTNNDHVAFWKERASNGFSSVWRAATSIQTFGRLSAFSYAEYLRIMGLDFDCDTLFLEDRGGSKSHRNGLCIVSGRERFDWHRSNPSFDGVYPLWLLNKLEEKAYELRDSMKARSVGKSWENDVSFFTLESTLCTYKSWHRPNRRYPNVYNDMMYDRLIKSEKRWSKRDLSIFWEARSESLPDYLRLEDNPYDPGVSSVKQNHYLLTGEVIMMERDYPQYSNEFASDVSSRKFGRRKQ